MEVKNWYYTLTLHTERPNGNPSSGFYSIPLTGGDGGGKDSDLVHCCAELVTIGPHVSNLSGGLPGCVPVI